MKRRKFIEQIGKISLSGAGILVLSSLINSCETDESPFVPSNKKININDYPELLEVGGVAAIFLKENPVPIIIFRRSENEFDVIDRTCTHQGCTVGLPNSETQIMECPCHGAQFDVNDLSVVRNPSDGTVIKTLSKYKYSFDSSSNTIEVNFSEKY